MPAFDRTLDADLMQLRIDEELQHMLPDGPPAPGRRVTRALVKQGPMRIILIALGPGARIPEHLADGPILVQPVRGSIRFEVGGQSHELTPGDLLTLEAGREHAVESPEGGVFLLTMALVPPAGEGSRG